TARRASKTDLSSSSGFAFFSCRTSEVCFAKTTRSACKTNFARCSGFAFFTCRTSEARFSKIARSSGRSCIASASFGIKCVRDTQQLFCSQVHIVCAARRVKFHFQVFLPNTPVNLTECAEKRCTAHTQRYRKQTKLIGAYFMPFHIRHKVHVDNG